MPSISLPAATLAAGALGGAASLGTGLANAGAMNNAAKAQTAQEQAALNLQKQMFGQTQANLSPFMQAGNNALNAELGMLGLGGVSQPDYAAYVQNNPDLLAAYQQNGGGQDMASWGQQHWQQYGQNEGRQVTPFSGSGSAATTPDLMSTLTSNPLYKAMIGSGDQAILANASATGGLRSGNANYNLANFNANSLAQTYQSLLSSLSGISGLGESAAAGAGQIGQGYAQLGTGALGNIGSAQAGGILGSSGALAGGINGGLSSVLNGLTMSKILGMGSGINLGQPTSILGPDYNIPGQSVAPLNLSTNITGLDF